MKFLLVLDVNVKHLNVYVSGEVQYSRNNYKVSTLMHVDRTLPLWAFFDVYGNVQKIKMIGNILYINCYNILGIKH